MRVQAATSAGRGPAPARPPRGGRAGGPRRRAAARTRRYSGPAAPLEGALALAASALALPAPAPARLRPAPAPRRTAPPPGTRRRKGQPSGPGPARRTARRRSLQGGETSAFASIADHRLLDRLIRGRMWIGIVGFALIGIVTMQLVVLRMNTEVGRSLEHKTALQRQIASLEVDDSTLSESARIEAEAQRRGMVPSTDASVKFLTPGSGDASSAARLLARSGSLSASAVPATAAESESSAAAVAETQASSSASAPGEAASAAAPPPTSASTEGSSAQTPTQAAGSSEAEGRAAQAAGSGAATGASGEAQPTTTPAAAGGQQAPAGEGGRG